MMSMSQGWSGLRAAVIALGFLAWSVPGVEAAPSDPLPANLLEYGTAGAIDLQGITGSNVVSYVPITNAAIDPASNVPLGAFQVTSLPSDQVTTYNNTPFNITFVPSAFDNKPLGASDPIMLTGHLNGTITGSYQSNVKVSFDPPTNPSFAFGAGTGTLNLLKDDQKLLVPSSAGGTTTLEASIAPTQVPAPEPSTIALFLSTVGGLGLRKYVQTRRQRGQA